MPPRPGSAIIAVEAGRTLLIDREALVDGGRCGRHQRRRPRARWLSRCACSSSPASRRAIALGADLVRRLRGKTSVAAHRASAAPRSSREGLNSLFPMNDLAVMGWVDVLPRLPLLLWRARQVARAILAAAARRRRASSTPRSSRDGRRAGAASGRQDADPALCRARGLGVQPGAREGAQRPVRRSPRHPAVRAEGHGRARRPADELCRAPGRRSGTRRARAFPRRGRCSCCPAAARGELRRHLPLLRDVGDRAGAAIRG